MTYTNYTFQCPRCHLVSGMVSITPDDAPTCCDGVRMVAIRHDYETPRTVGEVLDDANPTIAALRERVRELEAALDEMTEQRNHYMNQMGRWLDKPPERIG